MKLLELIAEWRNRLKRIVPLAEDSTGGQAWLWSIRARILRFLISRYDAAPGSAEPVVREFTPPTTLPRTFCRVISADGPPPRSSAEIGILLEDIRRCNRRHHRAWLLWILGFRP